MLTNSRDIIRRLEREGWRVIRVNGSHHHFAKDGHRNIVTVPHPKADISIGTVRNIHRQAGGQGRGLITRPFAWPPHSAAAER